MFSGVTYFIVDYGLLPSFFFFFAECLVPHVVYRLVYTMQLQTACGASPVSGSKSSIHSTGAARCDSDKASNVERVM